MAKGLARKMCPVDRQGVGDLTAAGAAYNEHSLGISVNVQHLPALKGGYIHHHSAQHTDFLIGGQNGLQTGVLQGLILQCGQRHGNGAIPSSAPSVVPRAPTVSPSTKRSSPSVSIFFAQPGSFSHTMSRWPCKITAGAFS